MDAEATSLGVRGAETVATTKTNTKLVLPPRLIARILDMAGLVEETPESAYLGRILRRDLSCEHLSLGRCPAGGRLLNQPRIDWRMRGVLVDWIVEVHASDSLQCRTLFLAISILDRYLTVRPVSEPDLQLIGACALLIASKMEDVEPVAMHRLGYLCAGRYSHEDFSNTECPILSALGFAIEAPTVVEFLPHLIAVFQAQANTGGELRGEDPVALARRYGALSSEADKRRNSLAWRLAKLSLLDAEVTNFGPSQVAAAALLLSNRLLGLGESRPDAWAAPLSYPTHRLEECVASLDTLRLATSSRSYQFLGAMFRDIDL